MKPASFVRRSLVALALTLAMPALGGCVGEFDEAEEELGEDAAELLDPWSADPCKTRKPTVKATSPGRFIGTPGSDVIFGTAGDDHIEGRGGNDIICAGDGVDVIEGGSGSDYIDGGFGRDRIDGGEGNDLVHGRSGGDLIHGGEGNDLLFGDLLDDQIWGDGGNDLVVGGHGTDLLNGGEGDDWLRGDTNGDDFVGGPGYDVASFATATPPGQPQGKKGSLDPTDGVVLDFHDESAVGDGSPELLRDVEKAIGSSFADEFRHVGKREIVHGHGRDLCDGAPCKGTEDPVPSDRVLVMLTEEMRDRGLVLLGTKGRDDLEISAKGKTVKVESKSGKLAVRHGCKFANEQETAAVCAITRGTLRFVVGWGDDGDDEFHVRDGLPRDLTATIDGGEGNDKIYGGPEEDIFFTGRTGRDILKGNGGDDALISETYTWEKDLPPGQFDVAHGGGGDVLDGGDGDDQLVADYLCAAHSYEGGPGIDVAGFARSGDRPIHAALSGPKRPQSAPEYYGRAYNDLCGASWNKYATVLGSGLEILEGSDGDDVLHGNDLANTIWGREGNDKLFGHGGDDLLMGLSDNDLLVGGGGNDTLLGGKGKDTLDADDGQRDAVLDCEDGTAETAKRDAKDPAAANCNGKGD